MSGVAPDRAGHLRHYISRYAIAVATVQFFIYKAQDPFYLQLLTTDRGLSLGPVQFGYFVSLASLICFALDYATGVIADRIGRRLTWSMGLFTYAGAMIWLSTAKDYGEAVPAAVLMGISYALTSGSPEAWIYDSVGESGMRQAYGRMYLYSVPLVIASSLLATALGLLGSVRIPVLLSGLMFIGVGSFVLTFPENQGSREASWLFTLRAGLEQFVKSPVLHLVALQGFFMTLPVWVNTAWWVTYAVQNLGLNTSQTAFAWGVTAIAGAVAGKRISAMTGVRYVNLLVYPTLAMTAAYLGMSLVRSAVLFVPLVAAALTASYFRGSGVSLLENSQISHERASALSFLNTLRSLFWFIAPPLWGAVITRVGLRMTFAISAASCLVSLALLMPALARERKGAEGKVSQ